MIRFLTLLTALAALALPGLALADFAFDYDAPVTEGESEIGIIYQFHTTLTNTGSDADTYVVSYVKNAPESWLATVCEGETCYPPFITEFEVTLGSGESTNLDIDITPGDAGIGSMDLTIVNQSGAGTSVQETFTLATPGMNDYTFAFNAPDLGAVGDLSILNAFHTTLTNTGTLADTYTVNMVKNHPGDWLSSMCVGETCYPPFITEITVELGPGELANLDIDVTPLSTGDGSVNITITSQGNATQTDAKDFTLVSSGLDVLIVDADDGANYEVYYQNAVAAAGKTFGTWNRQALGSLENAEAASFPTIIWVAGYGTGGLNSSDFGALSYMILQGGGLFLSGQDLASSFCDPTSPHYTASSLSWFNTVLGVNYLGDEFFPESAAGIMGDIVTNGLNLGLVGGDGADNNDSAEALWAVGTGITCLTYNTGGDAAVRNSFQAGHSFFAGFSFEGIDSVQGQNLLMSQILDWFGGATPAGDQIQPLLVGSPYASPNPFNPQTSIKFDVGGTGEVEALVEIYDLRGQKIRSLFQGSVSPGPNSMVWDGRGDDGRNLATGVYMARVQVGSVTQALKMTLVK